ncbi:unnamed protein product, partial [Symbiodinium microadriaticum]
MLSALRWVFSCAYRPDKDWGESDTFETSLDPPPGDPGFVASFGFGYGSEKQARLGLVPASQTLPDPAVVVFLDVDGVLHASDGIQRFNETSMHALRCLVLSCNATVILSSAWRRSPRQLALADSMLRSHGLAGVADSTPDLRDQGRSREDEILLWLKRHPEVRHWVALDDLDLAPMSSPHRRLMIPHFVKTDPEHGLKEPGVAKALRLLRNPRGCVE